MRNPSIARLRPAKAYALAWKGEVPILTPKLVAALLHLPRAHARPRRARASREGSTPRTACQTRSTQALDGLLLRDREGRPEAHRRAWRGGTAARPFRRRILGASAVSTVADGILALQKAATEAREQEQREECSDLLVAPIGHGDWKVDARLNAAERQQLVQDRARRAAETLALNRAAEMAAALNARKTQGHERRRRMKNISEVAGYLHSCARSEAASRTNTGGLRTTRGRPTTRRFGAACASCSAT